MSRSVQIEHSKAAMSLPALRQPRTIRLQLLLAINITLGIILLIFFSLDARRELADRLGEKHLSMQGEAKTLLPAVMALYPQGLEVVQEHIDIVCGRMQDAESPGHHIAVRIDGTVLQARTHHRASSRMLDAMQAAVRSPRHRAGVGDEEIIVGSEQRGNLTVYVSENLANAMNKIRRELLGRLAAMALMGLALAVVVNVILLKLVTRPLGRLVQTVHQIAAGRLGAQSGRFNTAEFAFLAGEINAMSSSLADADRGRRRQMEKAKRIQERLVPRLRRDALLNVAYLYQPADEIAGDYFDIAEREDGSVVLCVADVTGHGVPAAMGAAMLKILFDSTSRETRDPAMILQNINAAFTKVTLEEDFASIVVAIIDPAEGLACYASAGHEPALLLRQRGPAELLSSTGPLVGIQEDASWSSLRVTLSPGDRLVVFSDGVTETTSDQGELFGLERLVDFLGESSDVEIARICNQLGRVLADFRGSGDCTDDVTLVVVETEQTTSFDRTEAKGE